MYAMLEDYFYDENEPNEVSSVRIISKNSGTGKFEFHKDAFKRVLEKNEAMSYPIVVISVAGPFRTGKSFLLNLFVRYFNTDRKASWFEGGKGLLKLSGFGFKEGWKRETTGIYVCDKVFLTPNDYRGGKVAVVLMDTQGMFDNKTSDTENATIFSLSLLLSSMQVYNLSRQIQADALKHLHLFSSYAGYAAKNYGHKAFQNLYILIRDWEHSDSLIGSTGGEKYLREWLNDDSPDFLKLKGAFEKCFSEIKCCLLPHPGKVVTKSSSGKKLIQTSEIDEKFKKHIKQFVSNLAKRESLVVKTVNSHPYKAYQFVELVESYVQIYNGHKFPSVESQAEALDRSMNKLKVDKLKNLYFLKINEICKNKVSSAQDLKNEFAKVVNELVNAKTLRYKSEEEKRKVAQMLKTELSENLQSLEKRLFDQLKTKQTILEMLWENFSAKKDKHLMDYNIHMKDYCGEYVNTIDKLLEVHIKYKLKFKEAFVTDCEKERFETYEFNFNIKPVQKRLETDKFQKQFCEELDDRFRLLEKLLEKEKVSYGKEIARQKFFYEDIESLIEKNNEELIKKSKKEIFDKDGLNKLMNAVTGLTSEKLKEKLGCTVENFYFSFPLKAKVESIRDDATSSIKKRTKENLESLSESFENEIEVGENLKNEAVEEYGATCESLKTIYDAQLKSFIENNKVGVFKRVYRHIDFFGSVNSQIGTYHTLIESKADELKADCLNKYGEQTSVDYCGDEKFQFATARVLVEQKKKFKAEVKKAFEVNFEEKKRSELRSFKQEQETCVIQ